MRTRVAIGAASVVAAGAVAALSTPARRMRVLDAVVGIRPLTVTPLWGGAYWVSGGVSNTGFVVGETGVVAIDPQAFPSVARRQLRQIRAITPKPVRTMIVTHSDPDHVNGLPGWPRGMEIIAHETTARRIEGVAADPDFDDRQFPPPPAIVHYIPTRTVSGSETMVLDGVTVELMHVAPAHTDGDLIAYLPEQRIVYAGDILTPAVGPYPGLHTHKQGSAVGWIETVGAMLTLDADLFVAGHGAPLSRAEVQTRLAAARERLEASESLFDEGRTLDEVRTTLGDRSRSLMGSGRFPTYIEAIHHELSNRRSEQSDRMP